MKLVNNLRWAVIAAGIVSGPALAGAISCTLTPPNSIVYVGQTVQLSAECKGGVLTSINWKEGGVTVTDDVALSGDTSQPISFTSPATTVGVFEFTVGGGASDPDTFGSSSTAKVVVMPASGVAANGASLPPSGSGGSTTAAACGIANNDTIENAPTAAQQCDLAKGKPALFVTGPSQFSWSCLSLTGGAEANCYATRSVFHMVTTSFSGGTGGSISASESVAAGSSLTVTATPPTNWNTSWSESTCGSTGSSNTSFTTNAVTQPCTVKARFSAPASSYTVTTSGGTGGGTINPSSRTVNANATTTFTVTANSGYDIAGVTGNGSCSGTWNASTNTYTTGAISAPCTVSASFTQQASPSGDTDTGIGSGLWVPAGSSNLYVVDQSGTGITTSYVPGCVNGTDPGSSSWAGCAANNSFTANGVTLEVKKGKVLSVRYKSNSTAGTTKKWFTVTGFDGGNTGPVYVWLTDDPRKTYAQTDSKCKAYSTSAPSVITGYAKSSTYCQISANTPYYLNIESDLTAPQKLKIFEDASDMLP